jgi:hypothetical protein
MQVVELIASLRKKDEEISVAYDKIAKLTGAAVAGPHITAPSFGTAKSLLLSKLGEFGFGDFALHSVLDDVADLRVANSTETGINEVLDRLLSNSDIRGSSPTNSEPLGLSQGLEQSSFLGRQNATKTGRTGLPSASKFGLFGDEAETSVEAHAASPRSTQLDSTLFGRVGAVSAEDAKSKDSVRVGGVHEGKSITYSDFMARLMRPENSSLVHHMKLFILSVLGPNGNATPPQKHQANLEYRFYGTYMLQRRCADFFEAMEKM